MQMDKQSSAKSFDFEKVGPKKTHFEFIILESFFLTFSAENLTKIFGVILDSSFRMLGYWLSKTCIALTSFVTERSETLMPSSFEARMRFVAVS